MGLVMIFFIFLKALVIGAIIGALVYAYSNKQSTQNQAAVVAGPENLYSNTDQHRKYPNAFFAMLRFIRNLVFLIFIFLIPFIIFRFAI